MQVGGLKATVEGSRVIVWIGAAAVQRKLNADKEKASLAQAVSFLKRATLQDIGDLQACQAKIC